MHPLVLSQLVRELDRDRAAAAKTARLTARAGPRIRARDRLAARLHARELDRELANGVDPMRSGALLLRSRRLRSAAVRRGLANSLLRIVRRASAPSSIGVAHVPLSRGGVQRAHADLDLLARRLLAPDPVEARGVARARLLLTDGSGPVFWARSPEDLSRRVNDALEAL